MEYPGLLNWANSVRQTMANDPGRQLFKDEVQAHGFSFLDEYLDNIISGQKQDSLLELVKTPGRKKAVSRNPKLGLLILPQALEISPLLQHGNDTSLENKITSTDPFHPVSQDLPGEHGQQIETFPQINDGNGTHIQQIEAFQQTREILPITNHTEALNAPVSQFLHDRDHILTDIQEEVSPKLIDKPNPPSFPPEIVPLRKSMKARDPSMNPVLLGATPGALLGGKRTSWLMKLREAKALEGLSKKSHPPGTSSGVGVTVLQGTKRKSDPFSGDLFSLPQAGIQDDKRPPKLAKTSEGETFSYDLKDHAFMKTPRPVNMVVTSSTESQRPAMTLESAQEGVFDRLKKTVEDLGVRAGKTAGKSVGSDTATALAEARAAAKAKIAERDRKDEELTMALPASETAERKTVAFQLIPSIGSAAEPVTTRTSTSTTPPHSPPSLTILRGPVFSKPPPVFAAREDDQTPHGVRETPEELVMSPPKSTGPVESTIPRSQNQMLRVSSDPSQDPHRVRETQDTDLEELVMSAPKFAPVERTIPRSQDRMSTASFDSSQDPHRVRETQDTELKEVVMSAPEFTAVESTSQSQMSTESSDFSQHPHRVRETQDTELEELVMSAPKFAGPVESTSQTQASTVSFSFSQDPHRARETQDTELEELVMTAAKFAGPVESTSQSQASTVSFNFSQDPHRVRETQDTELEELVMTAPKFAGPVESTIPRSQSQMSTVSSDSSQSQIGFLGHASKLLSSTFGTSKKGKQPEVKKVLQMAAVAAKKQQEEADKKVARLKEMESRRQLALQRKAEEERAKVLEEERKMKEEAERRKKDREEHTDKRPIKFTGNKKEEENLKKRKIDVEKKQEIQKPSSSILTGKAHLKSTLKSSTANPSLYSSTSQSVPAIPSENIELPEINSEYSDSEDEDRVRTFDPPGWAQSPELRQALEMQSTMNPDDIFGAVRPLKMEEIFKSRTSRFRARTSSANWVGIDRLTKQEEKEYARRMGFK